ncbi:MAG: SRPBCC domain-containing protein [Gemmatimonadaceae bacterium]
MKKHVATVSVPINAPAKKVWEALTKPNLIKQYFFGTNVETDWKPGSPIRFHGAWQGKAYEDKGTILEAVPGKRIAYTYWSSLSGTVDLPENYKTVSFDLSNEAGNTVLTLTQDNNDTEEAKKHSEANWQTVIQGLKKLVE